MDWNKISEALVPKAVETVWDSTEASICMDNNHSSFKAKIKTLCAVRDDLKDRTTKYKSTMKRTIDDWFHRVKNTETLAQELEDCFSAIKNTSAWIHVFSRTKLSRKMTNMCSDVDQLVTESSQFWGTFVHKVAERVLQMTAPDISYIPTQQDALNQMLEHLPDEEYRAIRVLGMSGAGKTTILKNLNNHEKVARTYERVIWVTVSGEENHRENLSVETLQHVIAERLIVDMEGTTIGDIEGVGRKIKEELEGVKFLLLLDDVKAELDLDMIGIPEGAKGSKVVMTTKYRHVMLLLLCYNIELKKLSSNDSWNMFHKLLDFPNNVKDKPQLDRTARKALEICDGLPLMVKMAARVFKTIEKHERNEISWSDGLQTFKRWPEKRENNIMDNLLKFCCDHLDLEQKPCFLYSALHPEDTEICMEGLLECWAAENFLKRGDDAKVVGRNILRHLKNVILLEDGASGQFVRMHKVIRAIALNILSEELQDRCLVRTSEALQRPVVPKRQCVDLWTDKEWISLANDSLNISLDAPHSSKLTTLFVQNYSNLVYKQIPDSFFQHMNSLLVLNLYKTEIMTLPSSIEHLSNLKVLYLNGCRLLKELPSLIGKLKSLEVLDIRGSGVRELPDQIKGLTRLRRLLISFTISTKDNHDVIFKLSGLEELIINVDSQEQECSELIEDLVEKVSTLPFVLAFQLCLLDKVIDVIQVVDDTVRIFMPTEHHLSSFLERRQDLETHSFQVFIGCHISHDIEIPEFCLYDRYVKYTNGRGYNNVIDKVLNKAQAFELINHNDLEHLSINTAESMECVKGCLIGSCNNMRAIVVDDGTVHRSLLPNMERLDAKNLPNLESFWHGNVQHGSLSKLRILVLVKCPKLTTVFSDTMVHQLQELEHLEIQDCCGVKEIVRFSQEGGLCVIPKLTTLILCKLPSLRKLCSTLVRISLRTLKMYDCPKLKEFPFDVDSARTLQKIEIEKKWWEELRWSDSELKEQLEPCCIFI
ncbi:hypothetical protein E3N88_28112 [Mikania micrantha]|uniref:Uncharacterized protein n=1 Tax=Mikania micrantha TaxID=192012 RepID=A0A5N6MZ71_9ASTR|nr:hypothetical protein E3N88_28112 [Mikania micrantha]